jgi:hypothetical protein
MQLAKMRAITAERSIVNAVGIDVVNGVDCLVMKAVESGVGKTDAASPTAWSLRGAKAALPLKPRTPKGQQQAFGSNASSGEAAGMPCGATRSERWLLINQLVTDSLNVEWRKHCRR